MLLDLLKFLDQISVTAHEKVSDLRNKRRGRSVIAYTISNRERVRPERILNRVDFNDLDSDSAKSDLLTDLHRVGPQIPELSALSFTLRQLFNRLHARSLIAKLKNLIDMRRNIPSSLTG